MLLPKWKIDKSVPYQYAMCEYNSVDEQHFSTRFRLDCNSKDEVQKWVQDLSEITKTTFRVRNTYPEKTKKIVYKVKRCNILYILR